MRGEAMRRDQKSKKAKETKTLTLPPPKDLDPIAKAEWERLIPVLMETGLVKEQDLALLLLYCQYYSDYIKARQKLREQGFVIQSPTGYMMQNPYVSIARKAGEMMRSILTELGLTPSARRKLGIEIQEPDKLDEFLRGESQNE